MKSCSTNNQESSISMDDVVTPIVQSLEATPECAFRSVHFQGSKVEIVFEKEVENFWVSKIFTIIYPQIDLAHSNIKSWYTINKEENTLIVFLDDYKKIKLAMETLESYGANNISFTFNKKGEEENEKKLEIKFFIPGRVAFCFQELFDLARIFNPYLVENDCHLYSLKNRDEHTLNISF